MWRCVTRIRFSLSGGSMRVAVFSVQPLSVLQVKPHAGRHETNDRKIAKIPGFRQWMPNIVLYCFAGGP